MSAGFYGLFDLTNELPAFDVALYFLGESSTLSTCSLVELTQMKKESIQLYTLYYCFCRVWARKGQSNNRTSYAKSHLQGLEVDGVSFTVYMYNPHHQSLPLLLSIAVDR